MAKKIAVQPRSYTLRLAPAQGGMKREQLWERLWQTHYSVNAGAKEFGELFLNLRGGLSPALAEYQPDTKLEIKPSPQEVDNIIRGRRRVLALGWLSVEDDRGAEDHTHRIKEHPVGLSLSESCAEKLLKEILQKKGLADAALIEAWWRDCKEALTAQVRDDTVLVNRAKAFESMQPVPNCEDAKKILQHTFGSEFLSLTLPESKEDQDDGKDKDEGNDDETDDGIEAEAKDPSKNSRGVYGELWGGDASAKQERGKRKEQFARELRDFLSFGNVSKQRLENWIKDKEIDRAEQPTADSYPPEVKSSGAPTAVAKRYRKLLVFLKLWPAGNNKGEDDGELSEVGLKEALGFQKKSKLAGDEKDPLQIRIWYLQKACNDLFDENDQDSANGNDEDGEENNESLKVFTPAWADSIQKIIAKRTGLKIEDKSSTEYRRLMFALAARRVSQTHSWMKLNEAERHKAAIREYQAKARLEELDPKESARKWLKDYEDKRGVRTGAKEEYRIAPRAIAAFDDILKLWDFSSKTNVREDVVGQIQGQVDKFGDPDLFAELADDNAICVWKSPSGEKTSEILKNWVKMRQAQYDQRRLKIPRYCHPNPFYHPAYCELGDSSKPKVQYAWKDSEAPSKAEPGGEKDGSQCVWLQLPIPHMEVKYYPMRWRSKRLWRDLGGETKRQPDIESDESLPRNDRLSLAAVGMLPKEGIRNQPSHPFSSSSKGWNARLQASRVELTRLASQWESQKDIWRDGGKALFAMKWFLTFSPDLRLADGPWTKYRDKIKKSEWEARKKENDKRGTRAKFILSRLPAPGLRVLSVDLGHRYAAACAVWETMTSEKVIEKIVAAKAKGKEGWSVGGSVEDLYVVINEPERESNNITKMARTKGHIKKFLPHTVFRRIGPDFLSDPKTGQPTTTKHPAPWARLERQFLIKLQGEERPVRAASKNEMELAGNFAKQHGLISDGERDKGRAVDELMTRALRIATLALKRHARRAKIAYAFDPATKSIPGMGGKKTAFTKGDEAHVKFLTDALFDWHSLAIESKWNDRFAREQWNKHIAVMKGSWNIEEPQVSAQPGEEKTRPQRRKDEDALRERLKPLAQDIAGNSKPAIYLAWKERWEKDDGLAATPANTRSGWYTDLRLLTDWIMGRRLPGATDDGWKHNVGGLSIIRIATMKSLYQLQKAFAMRAHPNKPRGAPEKGETNIGVAQSILNAMERMREQRVKQLASRITEAALGIGRIHIPAKGKDPKRPRERVDQLCHVVVIENLTNYRPDELQTRRENRQLMDWSSSKVKKYLSEACQLHGLHLREISAAYTSRQDSRTGAPGMRCQDVTVKEFMQSPFWRKQVERAEKKEVGKRDAREKFLCALNVRWKAKKEDEWKDAGTVRIPREGGELFVSADKDSPVISGLQADLNAAANIGLKALLDPDWPGAWWYVPCDPKDYKPAKDNLKGCACIDLNKPLKVAEKNDSEKKKDIIYLWRDLSFAPIEPNGWRFYNDYWKSEKGGEQSVEARVVKLLFERAGLDSSPCPF